MRFFKYLFPIFIALFVVSGSHASIYTDPINETLLEITDKYKEVRLGITETTIYLKFDRKILEYVNREIYDRNTLEENHFLDSEGFFVPSNSAYLEDTKIEYLLTDIKKIYMKNGVISFKYRNKKSFGFEDINNTYGKKVIGNFDKGDLEKLIALFNKLTA